MYRLPNYLLFIVFSFSSVIGQDSERRTLTTGAFHGIKVYSKIEINLIPSEANKAIVTGENKDAVVISLRNKILRIKLETESFLSPQKTKIDLYHTQPLDLIEANQGVRIESPQPLKQASVSLIAKRGAVIELELDTERTDVSTAMGGRVMMHGKTNALSITATTGSSCEAENLSLPQAKVKLWGGGYAYIAPTILLDAQVYGGSVLRVYSDPRKQITQKALSGKIYFENK